MTDELETAHNNLCLEVQRLANDVAQMRLAMTLLMQRIERLEAAGRNTVKVTVLTPEELVQSMKRRRNGDNPYRTTTETPPPEWGAECQT